jgi:hypothetical protein
VGEQVAGPATPAMLAPAQTEAAIPIPASPVTQASIARAQMRAVISPQADAIESARSQPLEIHTERFECNGCRNSLPIMAFGTYRNGRRHVCCQACNVSLICKH